MNVEIEQSRERDAAFVLVLVSRKRATRVAGRCSGEDQVLRVDFFDRMSHHCVRRPQLGELMALTWRCSGSSSPSRTVFELLLPSGPEPPFKVKGNGDECWPDTESKGAQRRC